MFCSVLCLFSQRLQNCSSSIKVPLQICVKLIKRLQKVFPPGQDLAVICSVHIVYWDTTTRWLLLFAFWDLDHCCSFIAFGLRTGACTGCTYAFCSIYIYCIYFSPFSFIQSGLSTLLKLFNYLTKYNHTV